MKTSQNKISLTLRTDTEVSINGYIAPIEYSQYDFHLKWDELKNLHAVQPKQKYNTSIFNDFLPEQSVSVGDTWEVQHDGVVELLKQLHPQPNLDMHINSGDSNGLWACLRAYNDEYADIVFRIHAEFKLKEGWFTPSQFTGHLIMDRHSETIAYFRMYVPKGVLNFDINWDRTNDDGSVYHITDIGYCPKIELEAGNKDILQKVESIDGISKDETAKKLIQHFYKSQHINWVSLEEALEMAPVKQKPIHAISIDGPLADESC
ncbi:hypothetical protein C6497_06175 [Candidatus Poribacteria bacterium]|nr:MAG: hypothetical protein C6497_06175 [Candidatus Poribacteria bacterium]